MLRSIRSVKLTAALDTVNIKEYGQRDVRFVCIANMPQHAPTRFNAFNL